MATRSITTPPGVPATGLPAAGPQPRLADLIEREKLRNRIERAVARLIDALDAIDAPAEDLEPYMAGYLPNGPAEMVDAEADTINGVSDDEPWLGAPERHPSRWNTIWSAQSSQQQWVQGTLQDAELVDEDGGDILDEPHDDYPIEPNSTGVYRHA